MAITRLIAIIFFLTPTKSLGLISRSSSSETNCNGQLLIAHEDMIGNIHYITLEGPRSQYPNIRRGYPAIRTNVVSHFDIFGDCCWEIYPNRRFRGDKHVIYPSGDVLYTDFQPISIKKVDCA